MNRGSGDGRGGVNLPALRGYNEALMLDLLRGAGPAGLGRAELAARTGLTPQAVSKITARLGADGLVAEAGRAASTGGKPRTLLRLVPDVHHAVGVHLDRDELRAVRVDLAGRVVAESSGPLDFGAGPEAVVEAVVQAVARVGDPAGLPPLGVGVAAPGPLDHRAGTMGRVTGFPSWKGFPLRGVLQGRLGLPVLLDKDTNAGAAAAAGAWLLAAWPEGMRIRMRIWTRMRLPGGTRMAGRTRTRMPTEGPAPACTCTSGPGWARGCGWAAGSTAVSARRRGSSGTR